MEIINELLSKNIGYLNALRNAEVLPSKYCSYTKSESNSFSFEIVVLSLIIATYLIISTLIESNQIKEGNEILNPKN